MDSYSKLRKLLNTEPFNEVKNALQGADSDTVIKKALLEYDNGLNNHFVSQPIGVKIYEDFRQIPPAGRDIKPEIVDTYKNLTIEAQQELLSYMDLLIENHYKHIEKWQKVREAITKDKPAKIHRVK